MQYANILKNTSIVIKLIYGRGSGLVLRAERKAELANRKRNGGTTVAEVEPITIAANGGRTDATGRILEPEGGDYRPRRSRRGAVVETVEVKAPAEPKLCGCGCGQAVVGKKTRYAVGHDMRAKSQLLARFDAGDRTAGEELVERGWRTWDQLNGRGEKPAKASPEERQRAKLGAKVAKLRYQLAEAEQELANVPASALAV